jgi:hypothetical protein
MEWALADMTTAEAVALVLLDKIADAENWSGRKTAADQWRTDTRQKILDTYVECLAAARGERQQASSV